MKLQEISLPFNPPPFVHPKTGQDSSSTAQPSTLERLVPSVLMMGQSLVLLSILSLSVVLLSTTPFISMLRDWELRSNSRLE